MDLENFIRKNIQETKDYHEVDLDRSWADFKSNIGMMPVELSSPSSNSILHRHRLLILFAVLALGVISLIIYFLSSPVKQFEIKTTIEKADTIRMTDGSVAYIQPHSSITYPIRLDKATIRQISLKGGAIFDVAKDATKPFVVECGGLAVTALGTVFLLEEQETQTMIKGIEGRIEVVELDNRNNKVILKAGDEFVYSGRLFHKLVPPIDTGATSLPVPEITKRKPETPPIENLRVYRAKSLVDFLERQSKGKIKLARKTKYEEKANVKNDLSKDTEYILQKLLDQTGLKSRPGKCNGCIEIYSDKN